MDFIREDDGNGEAELEAKYKPERSSGSYVRQMCLLQKARRSLMWCADSAALKHYSLADIE